MHILVTGGAGFIGSHTVDALCRRGHQIRILDNLQKPVHLRGKPQYIPDDVEFMLGDVRNKSDWEKALAGVDAVYHLAAYQDYLPDFSTFFQVNSVGTALLYEVAVEKRLDLKKVIVASSQAVYGEGCYYCPRCDSSVMARQRSREQLEQGQWDITCDGCRGPMEYIPGTEEMANPQNQYAISKYSQEQIALNLGYRYRIPTVVMRYSIVQGPRQSFYNAYSGANRIFCLSLYLKKSPPIYEDGQQMRDYVNIEDVVRANLLVLENPRADYQVYNVGGGKAYTVVEFYRIVQRVFDSDIPARLDGSFRVGDTRHAVSDISRLKALGWQPRWTPEKSVRDYRRYLEEQTDIEDILDYAQKRMEQMDVVRKAERGGGESEKGRK
ncbi:MAG: NAD-dependent epimerase/dehydratase family protein [Candidatus Latescibacteria bacterium]|nr:NAD-dependent epimerase/dehydratase family protein [Candidatus Latescibacterota bacterium]